MGDPKNAYYHIASLVKGVRILELLADKGELGVSAVAERIGYNRATCHRFLATFRDLGYVKKNQANQYQLTLRVLELGYKVANRLEIRQIARPYMLEISAAFHETINLGMLDGLDVLHIEKIDSPEVLRMDSPIGSRAPLYCTALGKAILANRNPEEIEAYLDAVTFHPQGPNCITSKEGLLEQLESVRQKGYAVDDEEFKAGLRCIAVPIFDHTKRADYAMSVSGFSLRMTYRVIEKIRDKLEDTGRRLSAHMGYTGK